MARKKPGRPRTTRKKKEISLPMEFNPGIGKYEPVLPVRDSKDDYRAEELVDEPRRGSGWGLLILLIILFLIALGFEIALLLR